MKPKEDLHRVTVRLPPKLWKRLMRAKTDGEIRSIHAALVEGAEGLINWLESPKKERKT